MQVDAELGLSFHQALAHRKRSFIEGFFMLFIHGRIVTYGDSVRNHGRGRAAPGASGTATSRHAGLAARSAQASRSATTQGCVADLHKMKRFAR